MCIRRTNVPVVFLAVLLMVASCGFETPLEFEDAATTYEVEPLHLEVLWCPEQGQIDWTFDFGMATDEALNQDPLTWPGSSSYSIVGKNGGAGGGGGGGGTWCSCSHHTNACTFKPEQQNARRWRVGNTIAGGFLPVALVLWIRGVLPSEQACNSWTDNTILRVRFELGEPDERPKSGCISIPVDSFTLLDDPVD